MIESNNQSTEIAQMLAKLQKKKENKMKWLKSIKYIWILSIC